MLAVAHRLVSFNEIKTASRVLDGLAHRDRVTIEIADRAAIFASLRTAPTVVQLRATLLAEQMGRRVRSRRPPARRERRGRMARHAS